MLRKFSLILLLSPILFSCDKWEDKPGQGDDRLKRPYCNDPSAVNYNWDFPGTPDNTTCFYPGDVFAGTYSFKDSTFFPDETLDTTSIPNLSFTIYKLSNTKLALVGFCGNTDSFNFTATKYYTASADSVKLNDSTVLFNGQFFCSNTDTLTGSLVKLKSDPTGKSLLIDFTVEGSGNSLKYHRGTAYKQ